MRRLNKNPNMGLKAKHDYRRTIVILISLLLTGAGFQISAQPLTVVKGKVVDATSKQPLFTASVSFIGSDVGTTTAADGSFELSTRVTVDSIFISYLGYEPRTLAIRRGTTQEVEIALQPTSTMLGAVDVTAEKERYRRKGNPAVELIRKVIAHKDENRLDRLDHYSYRKYEKLQLNLSNVSKKMTQSKWLKGVDFVFEHLDTTAEGQVLLPVFFQETDSRVYYRKSPEAKKEYRSGLKVTNFDDETTNETIYHLTQRLYQRVDIYQNQVTLFDRQFVSPLASIAPTFYRFYIVDTVDFKGQRVINLAFVPGSRFDPGFEGNLFVTLDSAYRVIGLEMGVLETANLNFVKGVHLQQEFERRDSVWVVARDELEAELEVSEGLIGFSGHKVTILHDYRFAAAEDPSVYEQPGEEVIVLEEADQRNENYWLDARPQRLTNKETAIYQMVDTLKNTPLLKTVVTSIKALSMGYIRAGPVDIGSILTFLSFNEIEGWRLKLGGKTNGDFHDRLHLRGYLAYGTRDRRLKFSTGLRYAFEEGFHPFPRHFLALKVERDNQFPGQFTNLVSADNFFLSFRTGVADKMLAYDQVRVDYFKQFPSNFSVNLIADRKNQEAAGNWRFDYYEESDQPATRGSIATMETSVVLQYAPNAKFFEGAHLRYMMPGRHPVFDLGYTHGWEGLLGGTFAYHRLELGISKRFFLAGMGYTDLYFNGGKVWGKGLPYILLHIPRANQTFAFQSRAYNVMNFMEFITDQYLSAQFSHNFDGYLLGKVPILRRLKLRAIVGFKALYGRLSDANNPELDPSLIQFPVNAAGVPETYALQNAPYLEFSAGVGNIFKFFRVDYVRRLNYLNHPNLPGLFGVEGSGLRIGLELTF